MSQQSREIGVLRHQNAPLGNSQIPNLGILSVLHGALPHVHGLEALAAQQRPDPP